MNVIYFINNGMMYNLLLEINYLLTNQHTVYVTHLHTWRKYDPGTGNDRQFQIHHWNYVIYGYLEFIFILNETEFHSNRPTKWSE